MSDFKLLFLDIETCPAEVYTFSMWKTNITPEKIIRPTRVITWAAKWEGDEDVYYAADFEMPYEDMIAEMHRMVDEADAVCHYNGKKFDMKHLHREFLLAGLDPPAAYKNIDLYATVKSTFDFPSYRMGYVAEVLGLETKLQDTDFSLWSGYLAGDKDCQKYMVEYNIQDVVVLEDMYYALQGWIKSHPNRGLYVQDDEVPTCRNCGSTNLIKKGIERPANVNAYQRHKCKDCGAPNRGRVVVDRAGKGVLM